MYIYIYRYIYIYIYIYIDITSRRADRHSHSSPPPPLNNMLALRKQYTTLLEGWDITVSAFWPRFYISVHSREMMWGARAHPSFIASLIQNI